MKEHEFTLESEIDGLKISCLMIQPNCPPRGIVQIVHGMCEYKERYRDFMTFLSCSGYITVIHDHRGHGKSMESPDDLGYMYDGGAAALVSDTYSVTKYAKEYAAENYGEHDLPYTLIGHSMGSMIVRCYIKRYDDEIDKLFVIGCPSKLSGMKSGMALIKFLESIKGGKSHSKLIDYIAIKSNYEKRFKKEGLHAWVNSDKALVKAYNEDPMCNFTFTLNGYENLVRLSMETYLKKGYGMKNPGLYIRFLSGENDPCAISKRDVGKAMAILKKAGYTNVRGRMYKKMRHEILNEPDHMRVYSDILGMIGE